MEIVSRDEQLYATLLGLFGRCPRKSGTRESTSMCIDCFFFIYIYRKMRCEKQKKTSRIKEKRKNF